LGEVQKFIDSSVLYRGLAAFILAALVLGISADIRQIYGPDWQTVSYTNSTTAYGRVTLDGAEAVCEDIMGVFISGECRGWQNITISEGQSYVTLVINGEIPELAEFVLFAADTNQLCPITFTTYTSPGSSIGYPPDFLQLEATTEGANTLPYLDIPALLPVEAFSEYTWIYGEDFYDADGDMLFLEVGCPEYFLISAAYPDWQPVIYSGVTEMFAEISINGEPASAGDIVAAFVGGECRGLAEVTFWGTIPFASICVYGIAVEPVSFRIYDVSGGSTWTAPLQINTLPGGMQGYPGLLDIAADQLVIESNLTLSVYDLPPQDEMLSILLSDYPPVSRIRSETLLAVSSANYPPVLNLPQVVFMEDEEYFIDLSNYTSDAGDDEFFYQIFNNSVIYADITDAVLHLQPPPDWFGSAQMTVMVSDEGGLFALDTLFIEVLPVNDPPQLMLPDMIEFIEDEVGYLDFSNMIYDADGDLLTLEFSEPQNFIIQTTPPLWEVTTYQNWATAYLNITASGEDILQGSIIAAFADNECRGVAEVTVYQNTNYAIFPVYCQQQTAVIFKIYLPEQQIVLFHNEPVIVYPQVNLGFPPNYYQLHLDHSENLHTYNFIPEPDWFGSEIIQVCVTDSDNTIAIGEIEIVFLPVPDPPDIFTPQVIRFAAAADDWLDFGDYASDPDGDEIEWQILDADGLNLYFEADVLLINPAPAEPAQHNIHIRAVDETGLCSVTDIDIEIITERNINKQLTAGWHWISIPIGTNHDQPEYLLSSLENYTDYLKGLYGFLYYYPSFGWCGSLLHLSPLNLYKIHLSQPACFEQSGWLLNPQETAFEITAGWNWISYLLDQPQSVNQALAALGDNGYCIKHPTGYALYYPGYGWIGPLQQLMPDNGYLLYANEAVTFYYPQPRAEEQYFTEENTNQNKLIAPHEYRFTASLTVAVPDFMPGKNDKLLAFSAGKLAGYASFAANSVFDLRQELGHIFYFINLYTNEEEPADLNLQLSIAETSTTIDFANSIAWQPDDLIGDLADPLILYCDDDHPQKESSDDPEGITIFPNPFFVYSQRSSLQIKYPSRNIKTAPVASIYNLKGQKVDDLMLQLKDGEGIITSKNGWQYPSGTYIFSLICPELNYQTRLLIIK
jgi:hypothetical protein